MDINSYDGIEKPRRFFLRKKQCMVDIFRVEDARNTETYLNLLLCGFMEVYAQVSSFMMGFKGLCGNFSIYECFERFMRDRGMGWGLLDAIEKKAGSVNQ